MGNSTKQNQSHGVKSDVTVAQILYSLRELELAGVTEIASHIDRPKSTVHNHLSTLQSEGLVTKEEQQYALSLRFLELGEITRQRRLEHDIIKQKVANIAKETDERVQYIVKEQNQAVYLCIETGKNAVATDSQIGRHISLHATSAGKAIFAYLPEQERNQMIEENELVSHTDNTITEREALLTEIEEIRENGYAVNLEEHTRGLRAVGVPVFRNDEEILGAISVSGPTHRMQDERLEEGIPNLLLAETNEIELTVSFD